MLANVYMHLYICILDYSIKTFYIFFLPLDTILVNQKDYIKNQERVMSSISFHRPCKKALTLCTLFCARVCACVCVSGRRAVGAALSKVSYSHTVSLLKLGSFLTINAVCHIFWFFNINVFCVPVQGWPLNIALEYIDEINLLVCILLGALGLSNEWVSSEFLFGSLPLSDIGSNIIWENSHYFLCVVYIWEKGQEFSLLWSSERTGLYKLWFWL